MVGWHELCSRQAVRWFMPVFCLLFATACNEKSPVGPTVVLNQRFTLAPGETASVEDAGLRVLFVEVTGDSQCPADVVCIQVGDALVHVRVFDGQGTPAAYDLHTGDAFKSGVVHRLARIALIELQPYPFSSRTIAEEDYRATFTVTSR